MNKLILMILAVTLTSCSYPKKSYCDLAAVEQKWPDRSFRGPVNKDGVVSLVESLGMSNDFRTKYERFMKSYGNDCCMYEFRSNQKSWDRLAGMSGFVILRGDEVVDVLILVRN